MIIGLDHAAVRNVVKRIVIAESRLSLTPDDIPDDEPLTGEILRVNSLGLVGMLVRLEDTLDIVLSDDLFLGRRFRTVEDLVQAVVHGAEPGR